MGLITLILYLLIVVFYLFCYMKIFSKAGEPMWKAIVPIYSQYVYCKIVWNGAAFLRMILWSVLSSVMLTVSSSAVSSSNLTLIMSALGYVFALLMVVLSIRIIHHLSTAFGHGVGFTLGLLFIPIIFIPVLALGSSVYVYSEEDIDYDDVTETTPPGSVFDSPITDREKQIISQIREKKQQGNKSLTAEEKAVVEKIKWKKEHGQL